MLGVLEALRIGGRPSSLSNPASRNSCLEFCERKKTMSKSPKSVLPRVYEYNDEVNFDPPFYYRKF